MKDPIDKVADSAKKVVDDARDGFNEARHRTAADVERADRESAGEVMSPGQKAASITREAEERLGAEVDKLKRNVRDAT